MSKTPSMQYAMSSILVVTLLDNQDILLAMLAEARGIRPVR